jgi:threonine/homoserine/homoserine lactone efflux protein
MRENHPMAASSVLAFWAVALVLIVVPGPDWAFVLGSGVRGRSAVPAVAGLVIGYGAVTVVVAAGVGALVARSPVLLTGLIFVGGLYLVWLGARTLARAKATGALAGAGAGHGGDGQPGTGRANTGRPNTGGANTGRATLARGMGVSALNPKGLLLFVALLPQFTSPRWSWPLAAQLGLLGLVFVVNCAAFYLCLGTFARRILHARPAAALALTRFSGAAMIVIGALLLVERLAA